MEITFHLPGDFELPKFYNTEPPEQIALALRLGAEAVNHIVKDATNLIREETHEQTVKEIEEKYAQRMEKEKKEHKKMEEALEQAKDRVASLELANAKWQKDLLTRAEQMMAPTIEAKDKEIENLNRTIQLMRTMETKLDKINETINKTQNNSYLKGRSGESQVEEMLKLSLDCEVIPVHKDAYSGDLHIIRGKGKYKYLVDSKNYERFILQKEIDKLHRDLRVNDDAVGAIMISLNSGITGHSRAGDIDIEFNEHGKPIVFIGNLLRRDEIPILFASLRPFFEVVEQKVEERKENSSFFNETTIKLQQQSRLITSMVRNHSQSLQEFKNMFMNHRKLIENNFIELQGKINQLDSSIKGLLEVAMGDTDQMKHALQDSTMPLPSNVFKKTKRTELTESENKFIEWMEKHYEFDDDKEIDLKSFLQKAVEDGFSEKEFRSMREKLFTESSWAKQGRKLTGFALKK